MGVGMTPGLKFRVFDILRSDPGPNSCSNLVLRVFRLLNDISRNLTKTPCPVAQQCPVPDI
jgi:hypothetical protein